MSDLIAEHTPWTVEQWAERWQKEADARNALFQENKAMREAIEIAFRRVDFAIINHNLDGETSLEHMKQARAQLLPFVMP